MNEVQGRDVSHRATRPLLSAAARHRHRDRDGSCAEIRCPFHGFTWSLDGKLVSIPSAWLGADEDWTAAPELGFLGRIFNQDSGNLPKVQRGLRALQKPGVTLAMHQELKIRHFHLLLEKWLRPD